MRRKAFTLTEMLVCMTILLVLMSGISVLIKSDSSENIARQDMDRLARWLNHALARADRWKRDFDLTINLSNGDSGSFMILHWNDTEDSSPEDFFADSRVRWTWVSSSFGTQSQVVRYYPSTHSVTPGFTIQAVKSDFTSTGETLTLSVRALVTRESS